MREETDAGLKKIKDEVLACKKCVLYKDREENKFYPVIGEGSHKAKIMFVGEAPGLQEAKKARPFCGAAGQVLNELLESVNIQRKDVYIANILKDRPPKNRDPQTEEINACVPYLERQIEIIKPKIICSLGRYSMNYLMDKLGLSEQIQPISVIHGQSFRGKGIFKDIIIVPFYHPAVVVYNINMKNILKKDFQILNKLKI